jgi:hypothetical protein
VNEIKLITLGEPDLGKVQMLCGHSPTYRAGYDAKIKWLRKRLNEGMRYTLLTVKGRNAGMIEYTPGEYAWRGVEADGFMFIHCFWVVGRNRGHGYGGQAQDSPCPYGVLSIYYNGEMLDYRPIGTKKLLAYLESKLTDSGKEAE